MARGLPADMASTLGEDHVKVFIAVDLDLDSPDDLHFWSGYGSLEYEGVTYVGAGWMMQISDIQEVSDISAKGATLSLTGIPSELISVAAEADYQGRIAKIKFGVVGQGVPAGTVLEIDGLGDTLELDAAGDELGIASEFPTTMYTLFAGYIDQMVIESGAETCTIGVTVESKLIDLERPRIRRYTDENQQLRYPGDLAFEFVPRLQKEVLTWGFNP